MRQSGPGHGKVWLFSHSRSPAFVVVEMLIRFVQVYTSTEDLIVLDVHAVRFHELFVVQTSRVSDVLQQIAFPRRFKTSI
jgi:hypothetical protein